MYEVDKHSKQCTQGQHRHGYYSPSTKMPRAKAVLGVRGVFWAQQIITELLVWTKGLVVNGYGSG
jgi:hypothetical protein